MTQTHQIVFIHGMYMNGESWVPWIDHFGAHGYVCHAPSWPYHGGAPATLRRDIDARLGSLTFGQVTDHLKAFIDTLPQRPILIGHSIGGLQAQKLVNDGYASAGVAISPAPPRGVFSFDPHFFRANLPHISPLAGNRPVIMTRRRFHYAFANTMTRQASDEAFDAYVVPESRNVPRSTLTRQGRIAFRRPHVPLLLIAAENDHLTPAALIKKNANFYKARGSVLDFRQFAGRSHAICNEDGWEQVADHVLDWLKLFVR